MTNKYFIQVSNDCPLYDFNHGWVAVYSSKMPRLGKVNQEFCKSHPQVVCHKYNEEDDCDSVPQEECLPEIIRAINEDEAINLGIREGLERRLSVA